MKANCKNIVDFIEKIAPTNLAEEWDNVGLMIGDFLMPVGKILVALDINDDVIDEALEKKADLIVTHHPFIFGSVKKINSESAVGRRALKLIKNDIAVFSAHTNLDIAKNGTNDTLFGLLGLENSEILVKSVDGVNGLGRAGDIPDEMEFYDFATYVKKVLKLDNLTITGRCDKKIKKVGLCTGQGSGREFMLAAKNIGCDAYITGDLRYHEAQFANELDLCVIDITHYGSEVLIVPVLCDYLNECAKNENLDFICIKSEVDGQTLNII